MKNKLLFFNAQVVSLVLISISFASCGIFPLVHLPKQFIIESDSFTLAWDPPEEFNSLESTLIKYNIYYRTKGRTEWIFLDALEATEEPELFINTNLLTYGVYEFAVSSVDSEENESELHTSLDDSASPASGWFVNWIGSR